MLDWTGLKQIRPGWTAGLDCWVGLDLNYGARVGAQVEALEVVALLCMLEYPQNFGR